MKINPKSQFKSLIYFYLLDTMSLHDVMSYLIFIINVYIYFNISILTRITISIRNRFCTLMFMYLEDQC